MKSLLLSVVIPVYNGEKTVEVLFKQLEMFFSREKYLYEVIFVHDCGPDNSLAVLMDLYNKYQDKIKIVSLTRNYGQHNAIIAGIAHADGEFIITMDEDLQHDPEDILLLIKKQKEKDFDVVYGKYEELKHGKFRNIGSKTLKKLISIGIPEIHPDYSAFRLIKKNIALELVEMQNSYTFLDGYISWITTNCSSCLVSHKERIAGESSYRLSKLIDHSINIFVTFSNLPLRLLTFFSVVLFVFSFVYSAYIITRKIVMDDFEAGYPSLIISIGFGVALIVLALGIVGEYIHRINLKTTKKPNYKVRNFYK